MLNIIKQMKQLVRAHSQPCLSGDSEGSCEPAPPSTRFCRVCSFLWTPVSQRGNGSRYKSGELQHRPNLTFSFIVLLQTQLHCFHCPGAGENESSKAFRMRQLHQTNRGWLRPHLSKSHDPKVQINSQRSGHPSTHLTLV